MAQNSLFLGIIESGDEIEDELSGCQLWKCNKIGIHLMKIKLNIN
jgi:hypothetical protein